MVHFFVLFLLPVVEVSTAHAIRGCIQKFPDWPPGARTANGTAPCHQVQFYRYFVSQSSEVSRLVASQRVFVLFLLFISLSIQSGNFSIHPRSFNDYWVAVIGPKV
jgi:hypothetical protein